MRTIRKIHTAQSMPIGDLTTYTPLPSRTLHNLDPFLLLNHHGPQHYKPHNHGLPFGPHPHRGMETVTFILDGDIMHKDSGGHESVITAGGVQWMTAGKGLIHAETSSQAFKEKGGRLEILQLWLNLPAKLKMTTPFYLGLQKEEIPSLALDNGKVHLNLISGIWGDHTGAFQSLTDVWMTTVQLSTDGKLSLHIPARHSVLFYVVSGKLIVNGEKVETRQLVEFEKDSTEVQIQAEADSVIILGHALPFNEPVVAQGPFVMNTEQEIQEAYQDYRMGKFGQWR
jgi:quercetin 2,3-dioxygenase